MVLHNREGEKGSTLVNPASRAEREIDPPTRDGLEDTAEMELALRNAEANHLETPFLESGMMPL